jgi:poly(3-hydroxybutyrate) depolymerase
MVRVRVSLGFLGIVCLLGCDAAGGPGASGTAGANAGVAGASGAAGAAGVAGESGAAGETGTAGATSGEAGASGPAGANGAAGAGSAGASGVAGATGAGTGGSGSAGASGVAGTSGSAGASGTAGVSGAAGAKGRPTGPSTGCNTPPMANDSDKMFVKHDIMVKNVDPAFITAHPPDPAGGAYTWTKRNYYLKLPPEYDPTKPYLVSLGGTGCSGNDTVGSGGSYYLGQMVTAARPETIEVSLSYVVYTNTRKPTCFADDYTNSPEPQYIDAIIGELEANYCVDRGKVFIHGHSSGAWETLTMGCARADTFRAVGTQVGGGLRIHRPSCQTSPVAAIFVVGKQDTDNPIGPLDPADPKALDLDSLGTAPSRDDYLARNGCVGKATAPWDAAYPACVRYTGCPAVAPVVWCAIDTGHFIGSYPALQTQYAYNAIWKFWTALP